MTRRYILSLFAVAASLITGTAQTKPEAKVRTSFKFGEPYPKEPIGYFVIKEHSVVITSRDATIVNFELPRIGKGHPRETSEVENNRVWPLDSPEFTGEFRRWLFELQHVTDSGYIPTGQEIHEMWLEDHPKERERFTRK